MSKPEEVKKPEREELRIGVFVCHCGLNIAGTVDIKQVVEYAKTIPDVVYVKETVTHVQTLADEIRKGIKENKLNRVIVAACSPRMHEPTFRRTVSEAGLNPFLLRWLTSENSVHGVILTLRKRRLSERKMLCAWPWLRRG